AGTITLPSEEEYATFGTRKKSCRDVRAGAHCNPEVLKGVQGALSRRVKDVTNDENLAPGIVRNYYYACTKDVGTLDYWKPCYFLFFWICTQIKNKLKTYGTFGHTMDAIYRELDKFPWGGDISKNRNKCTNIYPDIMQYKCEEIKKLFDYKYNIGALQKRVNCNDYSTNPMYAAQLKGNAQGGYSLSCSDCTKDKNDYCREFRKEHPSCGTKKELPKLECPDVSTRAEVSHDLEAVGGYKTKGDVDVSLPKVEGDLKGPEVDIKGPKADISSPDVDYTNLFSGMRSNYSSGRGSRRRRSVEPNIGAFTDESTEYMTNYTTEDSTTIGDSTDESTVYGGQSGQRRNNGRSQGKNIRYQRI
ncbi:Uncharacterized protein PCOAH_00001490, partial [Plasmodium coatneyi]